MVLKGNNVPWNMAEKAVCDHNLETKGSPPLRSIRLFCEGLLYGCLVLCLVLREKPQRKD